MRRRLLVVLLVFSVLAVAGFAVPLLYSTAANRTYEFTLSRTADVARFAALAQTVFAGGPADQLRAEVRAHARLFGDGVVVVDARRRPVIAEGIEATEPEVVAAVDAVLRNVPRPPPADLRPWSSGEVLFSQPIGTGVQVSGAVVLRTSVRPAAADVAVRWAVILLAALAAAAAVVVVVFRLARWLLRPIDELAVGLHRMTEGRERTQVDIVAGPPELRGLAEEFNRMSDALAESAQRQRALVADVSHQLRNPMTALRLRLDSAAADQSVMAEVERLEALLDGMLALATVDSVATELAVSGSVARCDAITVLAERVDAWHDAATRASVTLTGPPDPPATLPVRCTESELAQVLDVLLDNAIKYAGRGATVRWYGQALAGVVVIEVSDDGPGVAAADLPRLTERFWRTDKGAGSGLGLAIAERLVTARGGQFTIHSGTGLTVRVELPGADQ